MKKRLLITMVSIISVALLFCGWTAFASTSSNSQTSATVQGTFKSISPDGTKVTVTTASGDQTVSLAKSVWVYRDEQKAQLSNLKSGDKIELILNTKQQAAYVKALSEDTAASATPQESQPSPTPAATATPSPTPATTVTSDAGKPAMNATSSPLVKEVYPGLNGIDLKIDGKHFKLHIQQIPGTDGQLYDFHIKPDGAGMVHLKGDEAAALIQKLLSGIDLKSSDAEQLLLNELADHYGLDSNKLNIQMKADWKKAPANSKHDDDDDEDEDEDKDEDDSKEDKRGNNNNNNNYVKKAEKAEKNKKNDKQEQGNKHDDD